MTSNPPNDSPNDRSSQRNDWSANTTQVMSTLRLPKAELDESSGTGIAPEPAAAEEDNSWTLRDDRETQRSALTFRTLCYLPVAATVGLLVGLSLFNDSVVALSLKMIFTAILLLSLKRWTGAVLFAFVLLDLLVREPRRNQLAEPGDAVLFVVAVLTLLMLTSRFRTLRQADGRSIFHLLQKVLSVADRSPIIEQNRPPVMQTDPQAIGQTLISLVLSVCCLVILTCTAVLILNPLSAMRNLRYWVDRLPDGSLTLWPGPLFLVIVVSVIVLLSELSWRQQTQQQSRLYLRALFVNLNFRDLRMIVRRQQKERRRRQTVRKSPAPASPQAAVASHDGGTIGPD